jgi:hypothetical protein
MIEFIKCMLIILIAIVAMSGFIVCSYVCPLVFFAIIAILAWLFFSWMLYLDIKTKKEQEEKP